jgi:hypothetical protein
MDTTNQQGPDITEDQYDFVKAKNSVTGQTEHYLPSHDGSGQFINQVTGDRASISILKIVNEVKTNKS